VPTLNIKNATFVGHSMGGGEVARYLGKFGSARASKAVLIAAVRPLMLKTAANPEGTPLSAFDGIRAGLQADRAQFYKDLTTPFFGFNRTGTKDFKAGAIPSPLRACSPACTARTSASGNFQKPTSRKT
jgi:non-heme chloroperoxidase